MADRSPATRLDAAPPITGNITGGIIRDDEVHALAARFGVPTRRTFNVQADEYIHAYRWSARPDRRAEVVFALQDPFDRVWLHAKRHYPSHVYRLPSGGVGLSESVHHALLREVAEETGLAAAVSGFIGLLDYHFHYNGATARFASYIFLLRTDGSLPQVHTDEDISDFCLVLPNQLAQTAADLRNLIGDRRAWGQWRALAHDLVYERLSA